ncbi:hypothetical protein EV646_111333 [Kribbella antiqua]|uniref:Neutral zinc metallopeptidase n=1 Tax=Kribbella antiqua TaxID=2512217 RepID=A0A4R2IJX6_9ACTN|nr:hypothetical protein EV646_111333 [Kribbella antiqua]
MPPAQQQPPQGQYGGQPWQPGAAPYAGPPPQGYGAPPPGGPQFGWGAGGPQPPKKKGSGGKVLLVLLGVVVVGVVGLFGISNVLKHNSSSSYTSPTYTSSYSPTYSQTVEPSPTNGTTTKAPTLPTVTKPTAPRTTSTPKVKPGPTDSDLVTKNRIYRAGAVSSVGCRESRSRPSNTAGARANYRNLLGCLNRTWATPVARAGGQFRGPTVRMFTGTITSPCGSMSDSGPPFYCGSNETIYMNLTEDIGNYNRYSQSYQKVWARMWMLHQFAHEYGHHVQNLTGILAANHRMRYERTSSAKELEDTRRLELQASCFSDVFIGANRRTYPITGQSLFQWRWLIGNVTDYNNDHGDAVNHKFWATRGYNARNPSACNTFTASSGRVK